MTCLPSDHSWYTADTSPATCPVHHHHVEPAVWTRAMQSSTTTAATLSSHAKPTTPRPPPPPCKEGLRTRPVRRPCVLEPADQSERNNHPRYCRRHHGDCVALAAMAASRIPRPPPPLPQKEACGSDLDLTRLSAVRHALVSRVSASKGRAGRPCLAAAAGSEARARWAVAFAFSLCVVACWIQPR